MSWDMHRLNCRRCSEALKTTYLLTPGMTHTPTPEEQAAHEKKQRAKAMCRNGRRLAKKVGEL